MQDSKGRNFFPGPQGVKVWYRHLGGRMVRMILVEDGWWGVGPTGTIRMERQISNGDWYPAWRSDRSAIRHVFPGLRVRSQTAERNR